MATEFERFIREAQGLRGGFFERGRPITAARAPAWVDLLGGAAPWGGQLALGWPLGASSFVALQPDPEPLIRLRDGAGAERSLPLSALARDDGAPHEYATIGARAAGQADELRVAAAAWAALMREEFVRFPGGARVLFHPAAGPRWPASLGAALAQALVSAYGVRLAPRELALSVRAGLRAVSGPADDPGDLGAIVGVCAPAGSLLMLHQQPAWMWGGLHLPHGAALWALRVGDGRRDADAAAAAAIAYTLAADADGMTRAQADARRLGYLANLGTAPFAVRLRALLPEALRGDEFLARHGQPPGAEVAPATLYPVRAAAELAVEEHLRARTAVALLRAAASKAQRDEDLILVGELMAASHGAQRAAGLGDAHADELAWRVQAAGAQAGLYGARAPAAATGATLVALGRAEAEPALRSIAEAYAAEAGVPVTLFGGSAPGCSPAGTREL